MLRISICPAVEEDAEAFSQINEEAFGQSCSTQIVRKQLRAVIDSPDECIFVAVYRGDMIGYIHARDDRRTYRLPRKAIVCAAVKKEFRRNGVATALFQEVVKTAQRDGCDAVTATVGSSKAAQAFFRACECEERLNRKQYFKSVVEPRSPFIERLENRGEKD